MRKNKKEYDYGRCHVCDERMEERPINLDFWVRGKLIVVEEVPTGVCPRCGEKIVKADVGRQIANILEDPKRLRKARTLIVPVISFAEEVA